MGKHLNYNNDHEHFSAKSYVDTDSYYQIDTEKLNFSVRPKIIKKRKNSVNKTELCAEYSPICLLLWSNDNKNIKIHLNVFYITNTKNVASGQTVAGHRLHTDTLPPKYKQPKIILKKQQLKNPTTTIKLFIEKWTQLLTEVEQIILINSIALTAHNSLDSAAGQ